MHEYSPVRRAISRITAIIIAVIIVAGVAIGIYLYTYFQQQVIPQMSIAPTSFGVVQGEAINFTLYNLKPGSQIVVYTGDGNKVNLNATSSQISFVYKYKNGGVYLVYADEMSGGKVISSTINSTLQIRVTPSVEESIAPYISIPTIGFNTTKNPNAPIVNVGETLYLIGGFLQPPSNENTTIIQYVWDFANGNKLTIDANQTTYLPVKNPVNVTYSSPGLYPVSLTLITKNKSTNLTYNTTVYYTIAVKGGSLTFSLFKYKGQIPNPGVITVAENVPGGPFSFDPQICYESVGFEVVTNIFMTLLFYNGSSTTNFIPYAAEQIPTVENGGISNNYTTYTFKIRSGLRFSNGDPLTAYDVWYSIIRALLFVGGQPGTGDWILAQYLVAGATIGVPLVKNDTKQEDFNKIMNAVTYDNATNTVTFHLVKPTPPSLFFTAIADAIGAGIVDAKWLKQIGAGITFTPDGFLEYQKQGNQENYNLQMRNNPVASGPYMIQLYNPGQSIVLVPNPYYPGVPGIPKPTNKVIIYWVKDPETAYNLFVSGEADIVTGLPSQYFPSLKSLVAQGQAKIEQFPTLSEFFLNFNIKIDTEGLKKINPAYHIPSDYFANLKVRKAFAYAFDYQNYIDNIVGNKKYGFNFGNLYAGVIIKGLPYYIPPEELQNIPTYNLTYAKQLLIESGMYNVSVYFPIIVPSGDTVNYQAAQMLAQALHSIDPNIQAEPLYMPFSTIIGYMVPDQNPLPMYYLGWIADYPHPSDFVDAMYLENGTYPAPNGWTVQYLKSLGYNDQANMYDQLNKLIKQADSETDPVKARELYKQVEQIAINLYMFIYLTQPNAFWVIKPYMNGYNNDISYQENPMIGGAGDSLFFWWVKG
jgi:ABC-type transport system substrate-binding protein